MNAKHFLTAATVASMVACALPAGAQVLGGGLGGSLSGVGGLGGLGGPASIATGTLRDVNGMGRSTTAHAHETVNSATVIADGAAARADAQTKALSVTTNAASSAASHVDAGLSKAREAATAAAKGEALKIPASAPSGLKDEPVNAAPTEPVPQPGVKLPTVGVSSDTSAAARASSER